MKIKIIVSNVLTGKNYIIFATSLIIVLGALVGGIWSQFELTSAQKIVKSVGLPPKLSIEKQEKSPLLISSLYLTSTDSYKPNYGYSLTNISNKSVRAYTIKTTIFYGISRVQLNGSLLSHLISEDLFLQTGQSKVEDNAGNATYPEEVKEISLSVDFVEFADGTTWGEDYYNSAENLAGQRAGGKTAIKYFQEKLNLEEFDLAEIQNLSIDILKQRNASASKSWKRGFETGIGIVRNRIMDAHNNSGLAGVREELEKPFDASEGRKKR